MIRGSIITISYMKKLLNFLNTIATHEKMVKKLDEEIALVLAGKVK